MTMDAKPRSRLRFSIRSLMSAVVICAVLLTPIGWLIRRNALRRAWLMRAEADRARAIALAERARAEYFGRVQAEKKTDLQSVREQLEEKYPESGPDNQRRSVWLDRA